jgi:hypothetical protein
MPVRRQRWEHVEEEAAWEHVEEEAAWEHVEEEAAWAHVEEEAAWAHVEEEAAWAHVEEEAAWEGEVVGGVGGPEGRFAGACACIPKTVMRRSAKNVTFCGLGTDKRSV